ncbi:hypothetical protein BD779DRAFT_1566758 [Infundibulicybe gibba]|nr:hypothetical protein BD779DRAFT_1566758 [Infundibulicybe gibba]
MRQPPPIIEAVDPTREDARRLIDQEIFALEDCARKLKTRRNLISPINQLPPETLSRIFAFCVTQSITWVRSVTHVCRHWRDIALDFPQLWSAITIERFRKAPWTEVILRRSKMTQLSVTIHHPTPKQISGIVKAALARIEHTATLCIRLEALRKLELDNCYPNWNSPMLHNLTSLKIDAKSPTQPTMQQLTSILNKGDAAIPLKRAEKAVLAHLVECKIVSTVLGCTNVLNQVSFGPGATVWIGADYDELIQLEAAPFQELLVHVKSQDVVLKMMAELSFGPPYWHKDFSVRCSPPSSAQAANDNIANKCHDDTIPPAAWLSCLREMPVLRTVAIASGSSGSGQECGDDSQRPVVLPKLQMIYAKDMDFSQSYNGSQFTEIFVGLLVERSKRGATLRTLSLDWCRCICQTLVDNLEQIVGTVVWDGQVLLARDSDEESESSWDEDSE